jgi:hypothetical protein
MGEEMEVGSQGLLEVTLIQEEDPDEGHGEEDHEGDGDKEEEDLEEGFGEEDLDEGWQEEDPDEGKGDLDPDRDGLHREREIMGCVWPLRMLTTIPVVQLPRSKMTWH